MNLEEFRLINDIQEAEVKLTCEICQKELYDGDNYYETDKYYHICEDCMDEELRKEKKECERIIGDD